MEHYVPPHAPMPPPRQPPVVHDQGPFPDVPMGPPLNLDEILPPPPIISSDDEYAPPMVEIIPPPKPKPKAKKANAAGGDKKAGDKKKEESKPPPPPPPVEPKLAGYFLAPVRPLAGQQKSWARVGMRDMFLDQQKLLNIVRVHRANSRHSTAQHLANLTSSQQGVINRLILQLKLAEKNPNAEWTLVDVQLRDVKWHWTSVEVGKIQVVLKRHDLRESKAVGISSKTASRSYLQGEIIDLSEPPTKPKDEKAGGGDGGGGGGDGDGGGDGKKKPATTKKKPQTPDDVLPDPLGLGGGSAPNRPQHEPTYTRPAPGAIPVRNAPQYHPMYPAAQNPVMVHHQLHNPNNVPAGNPFQPYPGVAHPDQFAPHPGYAAAAPRPRISARSPSRPQIQARRQSHSRPRTAGQEARIAALEQDMHDLHLHRGGQLLPYQQNGEAVDYGGDDEDEDDVIGGNDLVFSPAPSLGSFTPPSSPTSAVSDRDRDRLDRGSLHRRRSSSKPYHGGYQRYRAGAAYDLLPETSRGRRRSSQPTRYHSHQQPHRHPSSRPALVRAPAIYDDYPVPPSAAGAGGGGDAMMSGALGGRPVVQQQRRVTDYEEGLLDGGGGVVGYDYFVQPRAGRSRDRIVVGAGGGGGKRYRSGSSRRLSVYDPLHEPYEAAARREGARLRYSGEYYL